MKRPDIEGIESYIENCCGRHNFTKWCESFGCKSVLELINYIKYLEKASLQQKDSADLIVFADNNTGQCPHGIS